MNLRHIETFYYVTLYGGIRRAVGHTPYGIQQPAISEQIIRLENDLGCKLFQRHPFQLTREGRAVYAVAHRFFSELAMVTAEVGLGHELNCHVRIGAPDILIQQYLAPIVSMLRQGDPALRVSFRSGPTAEMKRWLLEHEVDLIITSLADRAPPTLACKVLLNLPLVLLVKDTSNIHSADHFWNGTRPTHPLVCPTDAEGVTQIFRRGLKHGRVLWPATIVANSTASVATFVALDLGVGLSLDFPGLFNRKDIRVLPLHGFDPVPIAVLWRPPDSARLKGLLRQISVSAAQVVGRSRRIRNSR